jgi:diguanylate cyclase (GGDEF)-like protein
MDKATAGRLAERMRGKVEALQVNFAQAMTVSIGVADCKDHLDLETLINTADQALYLAKNQGRNRVLSNNEN